MVALTSLWLPIVLSAVFVFILSSLIHMATPWHKHEWSPVPGEEELARVIRPFGLAPGDYMMPHAGSMEAAKSPEFADRLRLGPVMLLTVRPNGAWSMGPALIQWFVFSLLVSVVAAYVAGRAVGAGAEYLTVFRLGGTAAFAAYALGGIPTSIWMGRQWSSTLRHAFDGVLYGMVTGGTLGWLWPTMM